MKKLFKIAGWMIAPCILLAIIMIEDIKLINNINDFVIIIIGVTSITAWLFILELWRIRRDIIDIEVTKERLEKEISETTKVRKEYEQLIKSK